MTFSPTIGFEVHAQLSTATKMFCRCRNEPGAPPNTLVCPVCLGLPGALPVPNARAIEMGLLVCEALGAEIPATTGFDRKNYFYPDLPKGYQITQSRLPLGRGGHLDFETDGRASRLGLRQVHVEEDAGKTIHEADATLVDMNRCGAPLVEIVTEPGLRSVDEAVAFIEELRRVLLYLGVTSGEMHEGRLRFDTNVSVGMPGDDSLGTATEIKNLNSFRSVRRALEHEIERQVSVVSSGGTVARETMLWDERAGRALPSRSKEGASDYRYFPEPDIPDVRLDEALRERVRRAMPELPSETRERFSTTYGLPDYDVAVLTSAPETASYFELTITELARLVGAGEQRELETLAKTVSNWVMVPVSGLAAATGVVLSELAATTLAPRSLAEILALRVDGTVTEPAARRLLEEVARSGDSVASVVDRTGLGASREEDEIEELASRLLREHPDEAARLASGEEKLVRFFIGEAMRTTGGTADPSAVEAAIRKISGRAAPGAAGPGKKERT